VVKDIHIQDSEHLFLSASRDKTVKLWLLNNHGDGTGQSACSWTTYDHRKPVFAVDVIDVMRQAVSCDGSVHVSSFQNFNYKHSDKVNKINVFFKALHI
jgi:WD repeat-containing protein 81